MSAINYHVFRENKKLFFTFLDTCDFGVDPGLLTCEWKNRNGSILKWELGAGTLSNWLGGPSTDAGQGEDAERGKIL